MWFECGRTSAPGSETLLAPDFFHLYLVFVSWNIRFSVVYNALCGYRNLVRQFMELLQLNKYEKLLAFYTKHSIFLLHNEKYSNKMVQHC